MNIETNTSARSGTGNGWNGVKEIFKKIDTPENWKTKSFMLVCAVALAIDPLFLFIPEIDYQNSCISFDQKLRRAVGSLRNFIDGACAIAILLIPRISLRGEMSTRIRLFYLVIDILSAVPIHLALLNHFFRYEGSYFLVSKRALKWTMAVQYIPRIIRIYPSYKAVTKTTVTIAESKWIGALLNLLLFLLCSYLFGAFWYVTAIEKQSICWQDFWEQTRNTSGIPKNGGDVNNTVLVKAFGNDTRWTKTRINLSELYCANLVTGNNLFLGKSCPINIIDPDDAKKPKTLLEIKSNTQYDFGMYSDVLNSAVASKGLRDFPKKFFYCFWWGLRNLSTFGQGLMPDNSATDILLAIVMCACGLFLVAVLIGNVQKYLLTSTVRSDEMLERKKDTEAWMTFRKLPEDLKKRIKKSEKTIWKNVRGTDEESLLRRLPEELRLETQPYLLDD